VNAIVGLVGGDPTDATTDERSAGCPVRHDFDPFGGSYLADPYAWFADARADTPVFYSPLIDHWVVTGYDDVRWVMRDSDTFSAANAQDPVTPWPDDATAGFAAEGFGLRPNLSNNDPPSHTAVRRFLRDAFSPRRIGWIEPSVRRLATRAVDDVERRLRAGETVDLVAAMLSDVPAEVLFVFLGIPDADIERVKRWSAGRALLTWGRLPDDEVRQQLPDFVEYLRYCFDLVDHLAAEPGDDYTSELLRRLDEERPDDFDRGRVAQTLFGLLMAGHETTTNQSANAVRALLSTPGAWRRLHDDPSAIANAVEELIRFESSVIAWRRQTRQAVTIAGVELPAGAKILAALGAGNRDPSQFEHPDVVDLDRPNSRNHLSFGFGAHYCLGAPLARLELGVFLELLTSRLPDLELAPQEYDYSPNTSHRGPTTLLVRSHSVEGAGGEPGAVGGAAHREGLGERLAVGSAGHRHAGVGPALEPAWEHDRHGDRVELVGRRNRPTGVDQRRHVDQPLSVIDGPEQPGVASGDRL
jgi:cytochrome P450